MNSMKRLNDRILKEELPRSVGAQYALVTSCEELTHWKRLWCWKGLRVGGEGDDRGWDGWMTSPTRQTWVWVNSGSWWWIGRPGILQFMGLQRVGLNWVTQLNWSYNLITEESKPSEKGTVISRKHQYTRKPVKFDLGKRVLSFLELFRHYFIGISESCCNSISSQHQKLHQMQ